LLRDGTHLCDETHVFDLKMVSCRTIDPKPDIWETTQMKEVMKDKMKHRLQIDRGA